MTQLILQRKENNQDQSIESSCSIVETVKQYIYENDCPQLSMNVSNLNIIDASKVVILCSTYHYAKYPHGQLTWIINSSEVKNLVKPLDLGNVKLVTV